MIFKKQKLADLNLWCADVQKLVTKLNVVYIPRHQFEDYLLKYLKTSQRKAALPVLIQELQKFVLDSGDGFVLASHNGYVIAASQNIKLENLNKTKNNVLYLQYDPNTDNVGVPVVHIINDKILINQREENTNLI